MEPITGKWHNEKILDTLDHQLVQDMIDNNTEVETNERSKTLGGFDALNLRDAEQQHECENISDTVGRKLPERPRRQPVTRNNDFLWTYTNK